MIPIRITAARGPRMSIFLQMRAASDAKAVQPPNPKKISSDMIGPPDPVSNLRKVIFRQPVNETKLEKEYREMRADVQSWNQSFWTQHNSRFFQNLCVDLYHLLGGEGKHIEETCSFGLFGMCNHDPLSSLVPLPKDFKEREDYLKKNLPEGKQNLTADEMSVFYKAFLDKNWKTHLTYNKEWYKKNVILLGLSLKIKFRKLFRIKDSK